MTAHALYTQTLSEYKSRLISSPCLTLRSYCHECHVNYHGMELWLSRHGIRIRELRSSFGFFLRKAGALLQSFGSLIRAFGPSVLFFGYALWYQYYFSGWGDYFHQAGKFFWYSPFY